MGVRNLGVPLAVGPAVRERVRWRDVDIMGVVYYGNYLRFIEAAEAEFFRALGVPAYEELAARHGIWLARVRLEIDFRAPARLDDEVLCRAELMKIGGSSLHFTFPIDRVDGTRLAEATLVLAALARTMRAVRIPDVLRAQLSSEARTP
jgi:acyl-CoA thioester hydrolase